MPAGSAVSATGRPEREHRSAQHESTPGDHPARADYADLAPLHAVPSVPRWNAAAAAAGVAGPGGRPLRFVVQERRHTAIDFERRIAADGEVPLREGNLHDAWNARVWLGFPRTKAALTAVHVAAGRVAAPNARSPARDAATLLDESGALVACVLPGLLDHWRRHAWREAFGGPADALARRLVAVIVGHGILARLDRPFPGLTAKALVVALDPDTLPAEPALRRRALDLAAAARIADPALGFAPADLLPLPLIALPAWAPGGLGDARFADLSVFRPARRPRYGAAGP